MRKNDYITAIIENIGANGEGIFHFDGATCFVPFVLIGEKIKAKVLKVKGSIAFCKAVEIIEPSKSRVMPKCPAFTKCGGCNIQHADYKTQLDIKRETVSNCLKKIARIDYQVGEVVPSEKEYGYRNKLQLPIRSEKGVVKLGFFREGSHDIIEIDDCPLHPDWAKTIISCVKEFIKENDISCYDENTKKGLLKHLVVREVGGSLLITLVASSIKINAINRLIDKLLLYFNDFSLIINENPKHTNVIFGDKFVTVYGSGKISVSEFGVSYEIGAESFMQVNNGQKKNLYEKVLSLCELDDNTVVIDGYSGAGVLTAILAKNAKKAYGVEIIQEAVDSANNLAKTNGLEDKMISYSGDCAEILPSLIEKCKSEGQKTVLVLDPPRKGVDEKIINQILISKPDKIVYVSCSPQSLARDLGLILGTLKRENNAIINLYPDILNYDITYLTSYDMFPQTRHVESLVCLQRKTN